MAPTSDLAQEYHPMSEEAVGTGQSHRIYERVGFQLMEEEEHHSFGCDLVGQTWELMLHGSKREDRSTVLINADER